MSNKFLIIIVVLLIVGAGIFLIKDSKISGNATQNDNTKDYQKVVLGMKSGNYYPQNVKVKVNQPVRIYLDKSVGGCYRSFTIRDFGVAKYLPTEKDYVEFTPNKKGSFRFACSMGMGIGTLIVE